MKLDSHTNTTMVDHDDNCCFMEERTNIKREEDRFIHSLKKKIKKLDIMKMLKEKSNRKGTKPNDGEGCEGNEGSTEYGCFNIIFNCRISVMV
jgi:hypothetical protein